ncbi:MAG: aminotransferase class I/II-fold pyridoxal phosphate-dependent enzyme [Phycisphaerales bacterium]|nr:aminotransferase class I/II-fold pyridoxal phosphate-dependent enzyme [Phycisphaerales bacterium]
MNFQEFKAFRDQVTEQRSLLRLDCMNPFKAMSFLKVGFENARRHSCDDALDLWAETMGVEEYRSAAIASGGVRASLKGLFNIFAAHGKELWLPEDVYPFYWDSAQNEGLSSRSFPTLPIPDFTVLNQASAESVVVITSPVSPLGRTLNDEETSQIKHWLSESKGRRVFLDTVYSYTRGFDKNTMDLFETGQCFVSHSLSKAWLERGVFGALLAPEGDQHVCRNVLVSPSNMACSSAFTALGQSNLPDKQQHAFSQEWSRLASDIREFVPSFQIPKTGYFAAINAKHDEVLKKYNALVIPATVFGSSRQDVSIISCLYDISS